MGLCLLSVGRCEGRRRLATLGPDLAKEGKRGTVGIMKMLGKPASNKKPLKRAVRRLTRNDWVGYAEGKLTTAPGVDLTKPTLPAGKYL